MDKAKESNFKFVERKPLVNIKRQKIREWFFINPLTQKKIGKSLSKLQHCVDKAPGAINVMKH